MHGLLRVGNGVWLFTGFLRPGVFRKRRKFRPPKPDPGSARRWRIIRIALPAVLAIATCLAAYSVFYCPRRATTPTVAPPSSGFQPLAKIKRKAQSLDELLAMSHKQLADVDIAEMNLLCATSLPGAEDLDIDHCLITLDRWAARVKSETDRHLYRFQQSPTDYNNSEGYFRMLTLITVLQQDFGVRYNVDRIRDIDFRRSQDLFIHGMTGSDNGGTGASTTVPAWTPGPETTSGTRADGS